jgi:hypothetical protein
MIIKAKSQLIEHRFDGDKEIFTHMQDNRPSMAEAKESRDTFDKSFQIGRNAWPVAKVPALLFKKFMDRDGHSVDWKAFDKWLNSDYGKAFKAS